MDRRAKGSGLFGQPNCHMALRRGSARFGPISNGFAIAAAGANATQRTASQRGSDQKVRQQNVNDEGNFSARPRASRHASKFGAAQHAAHPQWARRSGLRGAAELCGVYCRKSSEMRFTEAAFSVAKTVLPSDLAMYGRERFRLASTLSRRRSPWVHRRFAVPSGTPSLDAFFFVESKLRCNARATIAADIFCFARAVRRRISF